MEAAAPTQLDRTRLLPRSGIGVDGAWLVIAPPGNPIIRLDARLLDRVELIGRSPTAPLVWSGFATAGVAAAALSIVPGGVFVCAGLAYLAMDLVDAVYDATRSFPKTEIFCMTQQIRKAALSVPQNVAEGRGRFTKADQRHFYVQARGSISEVDTLVEVARRQKFIAQPKAAELTAQVNKVGQLISGLIRSLDR